MRLLTYAGALIWLVVLIVPPISFGQGRKPPDGTTGDPPGRPKANPTATANTMSEKASNGNNRYPGFKQSDDKLAGDAKSFPAGKRIDKDWDSRNKDGSTGDPPKK